MYISVRKTIIFFLTLERTTYFVFRLIFVSLLKLYLSASRTRPRQTQQSCTKICLECHPRLLYATQCLPGKNETLYGTGGYRGGVMMIFTINFNHIWTQQHHIWCKLIVNMISTPPLYPPVYGRNTGHRLYIIINKKINKNKLNYNHNYSFNNDG